MGDVVKRAVLMLVTMMVVLALTTGEMASSSSAASVADGTRGAIVAPGVDASMRSASRLPSKAQWNRDVATAMTGGMRYLRKRAEKAAPGKRLALNLDIDNTMLASHYAKGTPTGAVFRFVERARQLDIAILVNTARGQDQRAATMRELRSAGYVGAAGFDGLCMRGKHQRAPQSKPGCRARFVRQGYRLIANVGNRATDFVGGDYDRAFRLPNYGNQIF